ncbi:Blue copper protein [Apostasia shenzhenica]|uniref:Blue copper protein n=1 Tax=Apostasia shenzhenica TaxID=1088818 RepID=A0A2I0A418_9ASPA|nr:Blue copper protein [Apostasia shenzhenica]
MANCLALFGILVAFCLMLTAGKAAVFIVGDSAGWDLSADLASWPRSKLFYVGDVLLFQYSQYHTLNQVDSNGYYACNASNALLESSDGNTSVPLAAAGDYYFICGTDSHCLGGMKLHVDVRRRSYKAVAPGPPPEVSPVPPLLQTPAASKNDGSAPPALNGCERGGRTSIPSFMWCSFAALCWVFVMGC